MVPSVSVWSAMVILLSVTATVGVVAWFFLTEKQPENAAGHCDDHPTTLAEQLYGPHPSGPAGPDAESQSPEDTGNAWDPPPPPPRIRKRR